MIQLFTLSPDCFIWVDQSSVVLYDSVSRKFARFRLSESLSSLVNMLMISENLYSVDLDKVKLTDSSVAEFVSKALNFGCAIITHGDIRKPFSLKPILKVQKDRRYMLEHGLFNEILRCVKTIDIHLNGIARYGNAWRQIDYPSNIEGHLTSAEIIDFVNHFPNRQYIKYRLFGSFKDKVAFGDIAQFFSSKASQTELCLLLEEENLLPELLSYEFSHITLLLPYSRDFKWEMATDQKDLLQSNANQISVQIPLMSEKSLQNIETADILGLPYYVKPFYTGENDDFLQSVNINLGDIDASKREIFINQSINNHFFGKLILTSDGAVHAAPYGAPIGSLSTPLEQLLSNTMAEDSLWFLTRDKIQTCHQCALRYLCPPISHMEIAMSASCICPDYTHE